MTKRVSVSIYACALGLCLCLAGGLAARAEGDSTGRAGNWRSSGQGAPSVEASRQRVKADPKNAEAQSDLGWALRQAGDSKAAEGPLREAINLNPNLAYTHSNLSVVMMDLGRKDEALAEAKRAVELDAKQPIYRVVYGNALSATGNRKEAIAQYQSALNERPDYENAFYNLGRVLLEDGQKTQAKVILSQALALDPKDDRVVQLLDQIMDK